MDVTRSPKYQRHAPASAEAPGQPEDAHRTWAARKTLALVAVASSFSWALIIYATEQLF